MACGCKDDKYIIPAAERRHNVSVFVRIEPPQKDALDQDTGGQVLTWTFLKKIRCKRTQVSGGEFFRHGKLNAETTHVFECLYVDGKGITAEHKLELESVEFNVLEVNNVDGMNRKILIQAAAGVTQ